MNIFRKLGFSLDSYVSRKYLEEDGYAEKNFTKALVHARVMCCWEIKGFCDSDTRIGLFLIPLYLYYRVLLIVYPKAFYKVWRQKKYISVSTKVVENPSGPPPGGEDLDIGE